jgi:hypothetical protein
MIPRPLFIAVLEDETKFIGGTIYEKTRWLEIPDKKIKRLFYKLPDGNHLCLDSYNKYFHMIEATTDLNGRDAGKIGIEYAYIMGEKNDKVVCYKINLKQRPDKNFGNIERIEYASIDPFIMGLLKDGWR